MAININPLCPILVRLMKGAELAVPAVVVQIACFLGRTHCISSISIAICSMVIKKSGGWGGDGGGSFPFKVALPKKYLAVYKSYISMMTFFALCNMLYLNCLSCAV